MGIALDYTARHARRQKGSGAERCYLAASGGGGHCADGVLERTLPGRTAPYLRFAYDVLRVWTLPLARLLQGGLGTRGFLLAGTARRSLTHSPVRSFS
jgi:hypothetical protein